MKRQSLTAVWLFALALLTAAAGRAGNPICDALGKNCGEIDDGMGGKVDCGTCPEGYTCGLDIPNVCGCHPRDCTGLNCGTIDRGCGKGPLDCGQCTGFETCGGGGRPNVCGCTPKGCAGMNCGQVDRGCGLGIVSCGQCTGFDTCGGGGIPGVCGCTPKTCGAQKCGSIERGCGLGPLSCGSCAPDDVCRNGSCCTPRTCGGRCGWIDLGCGIRKQCTCPAGFVCSQGFCKVPPEPCKCGGPIGRCFPCPEDAPPTPPPVR